MTLPTIVIIGRPNVGKSLLFNRLIKRRCALVHGKPGMTLDFLREPLTLDNGCRLWLTDTGGVAGEEDEWTALACRQMEHAAESADLFLLVVDCQSGLVHGDNELTRRLRRQNKPWLVVANKADSGDAAAAADFYSLACDDLIPVSAKHGSGLDTLKKRIGQIFPAAASSDSESHFTPVAVVGRPNVGKSTFINHLLGEDRVAASQRPGTTRDTVSCRFHCAGGDFLLLDTAGIGRRQTRLERNKLGIAATRRALAAADCAVLMIDLSEGITYQDKRIAAAIEDAGCALVFVANKADLLAAPERNESLKKALAQLPPRYNPPAFFITAASKQRLPAVKIFTAAQQVTAAAYTSLSTAAINNALSDILAAQAPAQKGKIRPKLRYAHQGGSRPPCIVIHGNAVNRIDQSYRRYLANAFAHKFALRGNPVKIILRSDENPYHPTH